MSRRLGTSIGGFALPNPIICGSGEAVLTESGIRAALATGAAGVIAKSVNERPEAAAQLDQADYTRADAQGRAVAWAAVGSSLFCRSGLQQRAVADWFAAIARIDREVAPEQRFVAASLVLGSHEGAVEIAAAAQQAGLRVFELNIGAPHASEATPGAIVLETEPARVRDLVAAVRGATAGMQLWVKLTGLSTNLPALAVASKEGGADAVVMMGRFMGMIPDIDTFAPVLGTSGAYGGPWALPIVCRFLALSRRAVGQEFPLLGTNGVRDGADVFRMALAGASAVEATSLVMLEGFSALTRLQTELDTLLESRNVTFAEIVGRAADRLQNYAEQPVNRGRWQDFVPAVASP